MAVYESKHEGLIAYVDDKPVRFQNGRFVTEEEKVIAVLDGLTDCVRVDEPVPAPKAPAKKATRSTK